MKKYLLNTIIIGFIGFFVYINFVSADEFVTAEAGIQVSPNRFDWLVKDENVINAVINVHNYDDFSHDIAIIVEDFFVLNDSTQPQFFVPNEDHPRKAYDIIDWIEVPDDFTLEPNSSKNVAITINIPEGQPTSGYYGSIFFKTRGQDVKTVGGEGNGANLKVEYRVGVLITLAVQGDEPMRISGRVSEFSTARKIFWESPIELFANLYSDGNVHYKANGEMEIKKFGKKFAVIKVDNEIMYPDRTRTFREKVSTGMWDFGVYSAMLDMKSEDGTVIFQDEIKTFFVIPWKGLLIILGGIVGLIIVSKLFKKYVHIGTKPITKKE